MSPITVVENTGRSNVQNLLNSLLARTARDGDPVMITILQEIVNELDRLGIEVYGEPVLVGNKGAAGDAAKPPAPIDLAYTLNPTNVVLFWTPTSSDFVYYELRKGNSWDLAERILTTSNLQAILNPLLEGTHKYLVKAINVNGDYSDQAASVSIIIPPIGTFVVAASVVTNAITLVWNAPESTFKIDFYKILRNGIEIAQNTGTFFAVSEQAGGTYTYSIIAVDVAGNESLPSETTITTTGITDYIFFSRKVWQQNGTVINGEFSDSLLYFCILNETYQQHFASRGWASPQAQVNAGYLPWLSPFATTGSYEEVFDFSTIISNVIVNVNWGYQIFHGAFTFGLQTSTSVDGVNWSTPPEIASSFFVSSVRYVKVKVNVTAQNDKSLMALKDLSVSLNVKRENDGGESTAYATDPIGTSVNFIKQFVDVEAITVTPVSSTSTFATHEFLDVPHPVNFRVKIFDNSGVRITRDFRWNARGIV